MKLSITRVLTVAMLASAVPCFAANILVPNGAFTNTANNGTIGGGLLNPSGSSVIGSGPWSGTYNGILGIVAPPVLNITDGPTNGQASISGILGGTDLLGDVVDASGWFQQSLATTYAANTVYTLRADVEAEALLSVSALDNFGAGIALLNGSALTAASSDPTQLVNVVLLGSNTYQVTLQFTTGASAPSGNLGIRLYDDPSGLATAGVLQSVEFSNVTLDASPVGSASAAPEPGAFMLAGLGLVAMARVRKMRRG